MSVATSVHSAAQRLAECSDSPRLDAELLLCTVLRVPRSALRIRAEEPLDPRTALAYRQLIARRAAGEPVAYLTGTREFWSLELGVTPDVLVPRPETELLVELALTLLPPDVHCAVLDLGTGSGAVALALAAERPEHRIVGADLSARALNVAHANAQKLGLDRVEWRLGSWFDAVPGESFDVIVANPPYIAAADSALERLRHEPECALTAGPTGFEALAAIIECAPRHAKPHAWLVLEHGSTQADGVAELLERRGFGDIRSHRDHAGHLRVTLGAIPG